MKTPLLLSAYFALRRGYKRMTPAARMATRRFVRSQKTDCGYLNAGGKTDPYYKQFGRVLEMTFSPYKTLWRKIDLTVQESRNKNNLYGMFFYFLENELYRRDDLPRHITAELPRIRTTNAVCCLLAMKHQTGEKLDEELVEWLLDRQDETGGFYASELAPIPDLLSTAVALFTLRLIGRKTRDAREFVEAHWLEDGKFTPTILDDYSDVEYVFYGLMALGSNK